MKKKLLASSLDPVSKSSFHEKISRSCSPARIVILKPTTDMKEEMNESWRGSSEVLGKGSSMEDFLEEVKERLRLEMEGKGERNPSKGALELMLPFMKGQLIQSSSLVMLPSI
ncbi:hypothetical protein HPP92_022378 [Vanilla planifolia]|uniref:Uncharacterized protein n=1 Tax=Vanilla planifolia TaxID=51239 RepID=A0A835UFL3_VANPL|nr:hypothetical protein HPP92_022378 [Vanilla planifolia]